MIPIYLNMQGKMQKSKINCAAFAVITYQWVILWPKYVIT